MRKEWFYGYYLYWNGKIKTLEAILQQGTAIN